MVKFAPGDIVRFKPEHRDYRDRNFCIEPMVIKSAPGKFVEWVQKDRLRSCFKYRVELDEGPW